MGSLKFDEIGYWSEIKLDIVKDYASAYSQILTTQKNPSFYHVYIDAFSGAGVHISKSTKDFIQGSPLNALNIDYPFKKHYFIDLDSDKVNFLREAIGQRNDVDIFQGDCNDILLNKVFPNVLYQDYKRGLCLLDPYALDLSWKVIQKAGEMKSIEIFINFPVMDMNRNVFWHEYEKVDQEDIERMNVFWGDESWKDVVYTTERNLFKYLEKEDNETIAEGFSDRLKKVAGFKYVPKPIPMRNSTSGTLYYLFFASQNPTAENIINDIFNKYRQRGMK